MDEFEVEGRSFGFFSEKDESTIEQIDGDGEGKIFVPLSSKSINLFVNSNGLIGRVMVTFDLQVDGPRFGL